MTTCVTLALFPFILMLSRTPPGKDKVVRRYPHGTGDTSNFVFSGPASIVYSESGHRADEDEQDVSEDDYAPSRPASVAPSRSHSVAASRVHSRESLASGAKTPVGASREEAMFIEVQDRSSRSSVVTQAVTSVVPPFERMARSRTTSNSHTAPPPMPTADRSIRENERERTVSTTSRVSTIVASTVTRDRKSSSTSRVSVSIPQPPVAAQPAPPAVSEPIAVVTPQPAPPAASQPVPPTVETRGWDAEPVTKSKGKGKSKTPKTSIPPSPIDPADTTVGKSPGQLAETLTSVWGSASKANTPGASPLIQTSKSIEPETSKIEAPPPVSHRATPKMTDIKLEEPPTPSLREAHPSLPVDGSSGIHLEASRELSVEITLETKQEGPPSSTTPADTAPPEHTPAQTPRDLGAIAEAVEPPIEQTWTEIQPNVNVLGIEVSAPGGLELDITPPVAQAEPANDTSNDGWNIDDSWGYSAPKKSTKSNIGWGSKPSSWSMPAAPAFGGLGSTIAGSLGGILSSHSPRPSPKPAQSSLPAERPPSLGGFGATLGESFSNFLVGDDKKSSVSSPRPNPISLTDAQAHTNVETAPADAPVAPAQAEEPPALAETEAPTQTADTAPPATAEEAAPIPVAAPAADATPEEAPPPETPTAAPGETGDGEGDEDKEDKEETDGKKVKAPPMKATTSKGGGKKKKKK